ncbi:MAG: hypothetical protein RJR34_12940 [Candidatus Methanoculleus thermohydrogenotrophicum]|nr:hypothetical protein [Candidatus Methanoculleus thermohydrogenotrophicum]
MVEIIDLSTLSPKPVIVRIGNGDEIEEIDLTIVPARGTLLLAQATQKHGGWDKIPDDEMIPAIAAICQQSNPKITAEWLETKLTRPQLIGLAQVVIAQAFRRWGGGQDDSKEGEAKNP